jgi:hypothetical protein
VGPRAGLDDVENRKFSTSMTCYWDSFTVFLYLLFTLWQRNGAFSVCIWKRLSPDLGENYECFQCAIADILDLLVTEAGGWV